LSYVYKLCPLWPLCPIKSLNCITVMFCH